MGRPGGKGLAGGVAGSMLFTGCVWVPDEGVSRVCMGQTERRMGHAEYHEGLRELPKRLRELPKRLRELSERLRELSERLRELPERLAELPERLREGHTRRAGNNSAFWSCCEQRFRGL